ncbi:NINE protein [Crenalkalicoccus roseus]|uniref:NINE protein n=1 Tax=Crenalkalicoccus roseus TaxID=1485588 RepID=UPI0010804157|nr:NINE protein [Crenalkalicoccus roseus]
MNAVLKPGSRRSVGLAYLLCLGLGVLGLHRLYLGRGLSAAGMAAITLLSLPLLGSGLGLLGLVATGTWVLADLLLIPTMAREANEGLAFA